MKLLPQPYNSNPNAEKLKANDCFRCNGGHMGCVLARDEEVPPPKMRTSLIRNTKYETQNPTQQTPNSNRQTLLPHPYTSDLNAEN